MNKIRQNFKYPDLKLEHQKYGASFLNRPVINISGDWRKTLPPYEEQRRWGVEPSSCYIESQQHAIATIEEHLGEIDNNYSARFNALLSEGASYGGDPIAGADSIRHDGLVKEDSMPHTQDINSWDEFHSWKGVNESKVRAEGKADLSKKERNFGVIITQGLPLETKYNLLEQGLKRSPLPISVWGATDENGQYLPKPKGITDTHMVEAVYLDKENNIIHILDTYPPFEKTLPANYNFDFGMGWAVQKKEDYLKGQISLLEQIVSALKYLLILIGLRNKAIENKPIVPDTKQPETHENSTEISENSTPKDLITIMAKAIEEFEGYYSPRPNYPIGSKSWRNKNPGNLKNLLGNFIVYKTYEEGFNALKDYIRRAATGKHKSYNPEMTLREFISIYAPDGDAIELNYAKHIASALKVETSFKIKNLIT